MIGGLSMSEDTSFGMSREIYKGVFSKVRKIPNFMGAEYSDVLTFSVHAVKDTCKDPNDAYFSEDEADAIISWITEVSYPALFHMYDYGDNVASKYDYFAVCNDIQPQEIGGEIVGFDMSFITNSPYAWTEEVKYDYTNVGTLNHSIFVQNSERQGLIFPIITVGVQLSEPVQPVEVTIKNAADAESLTLTLTHTETTIDCQRSMIYANDTFLSFEDLGLTDVAHIYWPRLYNGDNTLILTGDADFTVKFREPRKVGAY